MNNSIATDQVPPEYLCHGHSVRRTNFPLQPAFALTIHKLQGATLDNAVNDLGEDIFEPGMAYVALSQVKTLQGLALSKLNPEIIYPAKAVLHEVDRLKKVANNHTTRGRVH